MAQKGILRGKINIDQEELDRLKKRANPAFPTAKWIIFCELMLSRGYKVQVIGAYSTVSKYIIVRNKDKVCKVRFSDHGPAGYNDSDIFVGRDKDGVYHSTESIVPRVEQILEKNNG